MRHLQRLAARCCLLALLCGQAAQARTYDIMVVTPNVPLTSFAPTADGQQMRYMAMRNTSALLRVLDYAHADYGTINAAKCRNEWLRTGIFGRGLVTSGVAESIDSARSVIFSSFNAGNEPALLGPRVDSLFRVARGGATVPWLCLMNQLVAGTSMAGGIDTPFDDGVTRACSTGAVGQELNVSNVTAWPYLMSAPTTTRWRMFSYEMPWRRNPTTPAGGIRVLVGAATPNFLNTSTSQGGVNEQFATGSHTLDDAGVSLGADTMYVWDRLWNIATLPLAKTMTFVQMSGGGLDNADSTTAFDGGSDGPPGEFGLDMMVAGLCHFDSLTLANSGRRLVFGAMRAPRKLALTIDGGLCRSLRYYGYRPGIDPRDTTSFYESLDSLRLAGIPATIGVNVDSAGQYARDIIKLTGYTQARFTPQVWTGILDTTTGNRAARFWDIFGRWNNRTFVGDGSGVGKDSSITSKLAAAKAVCDSIFPGRGSKFVLAPDDDYSPKQMRVGQANTIGGSYSYGDSLLYAIRLAGFTGLRVDGKYTDADPNRTGANTNPRGWFTKSQYYKSPIDGKATTLLAHAGFQLSGGMSWAFSFVDSVAPFDSSAIGRTEEERNACGMWDMGGLWDADVHSNFGSTAAGAYTWKDVQYRFEDYQDPRLPYSARGIYNNCRVMRMAASDFSGRRPDPARTGWMAVTFLDKWFKGCNTLAGKTIMQWAYPEDIDP